MPCGTEKTISAFMAQIPGVSDRMTLSPSLSLFLSFSPFSSFSSFSSLLLPPSLLFPSLSLPLLPSLSPALFFVFLLLVLSQGATHWNAGLQPLLHAHVVQEDEALERQSEGSARSTLCSSRNTRAALLCDPQTRDAKWARGSRSQTHRRAAKGGFTQDDVKVRRPRPDRTLLFLCCSEKL